VQYNAIAIKDWHIFTSKNNLILQLKLYIAFNSSQLFPQMKCNLLWLQLMTNTYLADQTILFLQLKWDIAFDYLQPFPQMKRNSL